MSSQVVIWVVVFLLVEEMKMLIIVMLILICMLLLSSFVSLLVARLVTWVFPIIAFSCCSAESDNDVAVVHVVIVVCHSPRSRLCHLQVWQCG